MLQAAALLVHLLAVGGRGTGSGATPAVVAACTVCEHGAKSDGLHDDAPAFQAALDVCTLVAVPAAGCGTAPVDVAAVYLVGPVTIPSDRTVVLDGNITTLPPARWPLESNKTLAGCTVQTCRYRDLFSGSSNNVTISGSGSIEGGGPVWWHMWADQELMAHRPMLINLRGDDLTIAGSIYVHNSPGMAVGLSNGVRHRVSGYRAAVDLPGARLLGTTRNRTYESANAACLMLSDATSVHITNVHLVCGDDNIAMNAFAAPFQDVIIEDSYFGWGHGCSIGSMTQAGLHNITVRNVTMNNTGAGIHIKSYIGGGGHVEYTAEDIILHGVENPIRLEQNYGGARPPCTPHCNTSRRPFFHVTITRMRADGIPKPDLGPFLYGTPDRDSLVLLVNDSTFTTASGDPAQWQCTHARVGMHDVVGGPQPGTCIGHARFTRAAVF